MRNGVTNRVAISSRLLAMAGDRVTFRWKNYQRGGPHDIERTGEFAARRVVEPIRSRMALRE